jgi:hypothetical protein
MSVCLSVPPSLSLPPPLSLSLVHLTQFSLVHFHHFSFTRSASVSLKFSFWCVFLPLSLSLSLSLVGSLKFQTLALTPPPSLSVPYISISVFSLATCHFPEYFSLPLCISLSFLTIAISICRSFDYATLIPFPFLIHSFLLYPNFWTT